MASQGHKELIYTDILTLYMLIFSEGTKTYIYIL